MDHVLSNEGGHGVLDPLPLKSKPKRNKSAENTNHADDRNKIKSAGSNLESRERYPHL